MCDIVVIPSLGTIVVIPTKSLYFYLKSNKMPIGLCMAQQFTGTCYFNAAINALILSERSRGFITEQVDRILKKTFPTTNVTDLQRQNFVKTLDMAKFIRKILKCTDYNRRNVSKVAASTRTVGVQVKNENGVVKQIEFDKCSVKNASGGSSASAYIDIIKTLDMITNAPANASTNLSYDFYFMNYRNPTKDNYFKMYATASLSFNIDMDAILVNPKLSSRDKWEKKGALLKSFRETVKGIEKKHGSPESMKSDINLMLTNSKQSEFVVIYTEERFSFFRDNVSMIETLCMTHEIDHAVLKFTYVNGGHVVALFKYNSSMFLYDSNNKTASLCEWLKPDGSLFILKIKQYMRLIYPNCKTKGLSLITFATKQDYKPNAASFFTHKANSSSLKSHLVDVYTQNTDNYVKHTVKRDYVLALLVSHAYIDRTSKTDYIEMFFSYRPRAYMELSETPTVKTFEKLFGDLSHRIDFDSDDLVGTVAFSQFSKKNSQTDGRLVEDRLHFFDEHFEIDITKDMTQ
jgi:hypothetical protein